MLSEIYLALDLKDGHAVRLAPHGDLTKKWEICGDPLEIAENAIGQNVDWLHVVDLDAAAETRDADGNLTNNFNIIASILGTHLNVQVSGGLRSMEAIEKALALGAQRVVLSTAAFKNPDLVREAAARWPGQVGVGIDSKNNKVCINAWQTVTDKDVFIFAREMEEAGAGFIVFTDIDRDGTQQGLNINAARRMVQTVKIPVIVSGGVKNRNELMKIRGDKSIDLAGVIAGSAFYAIT